MFGPPCAHYSPGPHQTKGEPIRGRIEKNWGNEPFCKKNENAPKTWTKCPSGHLNVCLFPCPPPFGGSGSSFGANRNEGSDCKHCGFGVEGGGGVIVVPSALRVVLNSLNPTSLAERHSGGGGDSGTIGDKNFWDPPPQSPFSSAFHGKTGVRLHFEFGQRDLISCQ